MIINCPTKVFQRYFTAVSIFAAGRTYSPEMQSVRLSVNDDEDIVLSAGSDKASCRLVMPEGFVIETGECLLPVNLVKEILSVRDDDEIVIRSDDKSMSMFQENYRNLPSLDPTQFLDLKFVPESNFLSVDCLDFCDAVNSVAFAADNAARNYALGGILLEKDGSDTLVITTTDGKRLCHKKVKIRRFNQSDGDAIDFSAIIPSRDLLSICKVLKDEEIRIQNVGSWSVFTTGGQKKDGFPNGTPLNQVRVLQIDGRFPSWKKIIPNVTDEDRIAEIIPNQFIDQVRKAAVMGSLLTPGITMTFDGNHITLESFADQRGTSRIVTTGSLLVDKEPFSVKINAEYLIDFLKANRDEDIFGIYQKTNPEGVLVFKNEDESNQYVLTTMV